jgi:hypothetical protein
VEIRALPYVRDGTVLTEGTALVHHDEPSRVKVTLLKVQLSPTVSAF